MNTVATTVPLKSQSPYSELYERYSSWLFVNSRPRRKAVPFLKIDDKTVVSFGNVFVISGLPKTGKTSACAALLAGSLTAPDQSIDTLGLTICKNVSRLEIVYISTELSEDDFDALVRTVLSRANLSTKPDHFHCLNLAGDVTHELIDLTESFIKDLSGINKNGIQLILIDGIADYLQNVNDPGSSIELVQRLLAMARKYQSAVGVVIHKNPGNNFDSKMRGHLGSEISRKSVGTLELSKVKDHVEITGKDFRSSSENFEAIQIAFDESKGHFVYKGRKTVLPTMQVLILNEVPALGKIFHEKANLTYKGLYLQLQAELKCSERKAKDRITHYVNAGFLRNNDDGTYSLVIPTK